MLKGEADMKTCISTYSFSRLISSGAMNHFDVLDKIHELGVPAAELVLDDNTSGGSPLEFACRLADHARRLGLDVPIYTTGANFCCPDVEAEIRRVERHIDIAAEAGIPLLRHDITPGFYEGYTGLRTFEAILPTLAAAIREVADYAQKKGVTTCGECPELERCPTVGAVLRNSPDAKKNLETMRFADHA